MSSILTQGYKLIVQLPFGVSLWQGEGEVVSMHLLLKTPCVTSVAIARARESHMATPHFKWI